MLSAIIAILGGLIASSSLIVSKKPDAKELLDKLTPFQGGIGVVLLIWGIRGLLRSLFGSAVWGGGTLFSLASSACMFVVGFMLAYGLISKYLLENNPSAKEKGEALRAKLVNYQVIAGVVLIVLGVFSILF